MNLATAQQAGDPAWLVQAFKDNGLHEYPGRKHNARVLEMFQLAGHPEIHDDETAWCSAAMNAWMIEAGQPGTRALNARSWLTWGQQLNIAKTIKRGAVLIFRRGNSSWQGHVCFCLEDRGSSIIVYGGNQRDSVCSMVMPRAALIGARWPTHPLGLNSRTMQSFMGGGAAEAGANSIGEFADGLQPDKVADGLQQAQGMLADAAQYLHWAQIALQVLGVVLILYGAYRFLKHYVWQRDAAVDDGPSIGNPVVYIGGPIDDDAVERSIVRRRKRKKQRSKRRR